MPCKWHRTLCVSVCGSSRSVSHSQRSHALPCSSASRSGHHCTVTCGVAGPGCTAVPPETLSTPLWESNGVTWRGARVQDRARSAAQISSQSLVVAMAASVGSPVADTWFPLGGHTCFLFASSLCKRQGANATMNHGRAKPSTSFPSLLTQTGPGGGAGAWHL